MLVLVDQEDPMRDKRDLIESIIASQLKTLLYGLKERLQLELCSMTVIKN